MELVRALVTLRGGSYLGPRCAHRVGSFVKVHCGSESNPPVFLWGEGRVKVQ